MGNLARVRHGLSVVVLRIGCALLVFSSVNAAASDVRFVGNVSYSYVGGVADLTANRVENFDSSGYSGTLRMELWAFSSPYNGSAQFGYKLAQHSLGQLSAGQYFYSINSGSIAFAPPPNGTWRVTLILAEYAGGTLNNGYAPQDWVNFPNPLDVGLPPPPPPPPPTSAVTPEVGLWANPNESGTGYTLDYKHGLLVVAIYAYTSGGAAQWYLASGPVVGTTFTATLDKYVAGQCISCAYRWSPTLTGNDGTITIAFTSSTSAIVYLPGGRVTNIQPFAF